MIISSVLIYIFIIYSSITNINLFKEVYGYKRPNLIEMKNLYDKCIISNDTYDTIEDISFEEKKHMKYQDNVLYVEELKKFK